ncbi:hypothetical protein PLANPX_2062 [Lacipirellula parvula]|uniref:Uncharacterized protein n=1 Tax=Lacipirellula parvula TaxID=2650471 RepID=A0A5K7X777_9BACT|nr:hypothetical protein PLANPX_2062 [Lacipirellula parvula]
MQPSGDSRWSGEGLVWQATFGFTNHSPRRTQPRSVDFGGALPWPSINSTRMRAPETVRWHCWSEQ